MALRLGGTLGAAIRGVAEGQRRKSERELQAEELKLSRQREGAAILEQQKVSQLRDIKAKQEHAGEEQRQQIEKEDASRRAALDTATTKMKAFDSAFKAAAAAPLGSKEQTFTNAYRALLPGEEVPAVQFGQAGKLAKVKLSDGSVITGPANRIAEVSRAMALDPTKAKETMAAAIKARVVQVSEFAPGAKPAPGPTAPTGYRFVGESGQLEAIPGGPADRPAPGPTVSQISSGINSILKKYNTGGVINVLPDGTIDINAALQGKKSAFEVLRIRAATDQNAARDLQTLEQLYDNLEQSLLGEQRRPMELFNRGTRGTKIQKPLHREVQYEATATNPQTKEKRGLINGQWVPIPASTTASGI